MNPRTSLGIGALGAAALLPTAAFAHGGHGDSFGGGLLHPFTGLDHALAALAAGWWAASSDRRTGLLGAGAFLLALIGGMAIGSTGVVMIGQEAALAGTVIALGGLLALGIRPNLKSAAPLLSGFALIHGLAHGAENPSSAPLAGIVIGTVLLLIAGVLAGTFARSPQRVALNRFAGLAAAVAGAAMLMR